MTQIIKKQSKKNHQLLPTPNTFSLEGKTPEQVNEAVDSMSKEELTAIVKANLLPLVDPEKYKETIRALMPEFVKEMDNKEDLAQAALQTNQEFLLIIIDCLKRYHGWNDQEIKQLHTELIDVLTVTKEFEDSGLSILSPHSVAVVGDKVQEVGVTKLLGEIRKIRFDHAKIVRTGLDVPNQLSGSKIDRQLQKPRR